MKRILNKIIAMGILVASPTLGLSAPPATPTSSTTGRQTNPGALSFGDAVNGITAKYQAKRQALIAERKALFERLTNNPDPKERKNLLKQLDTQLKASFAKEAVVEKQLRAELATLHGQHIKQRLSLKSGSESTPLPDAQ